MRAFRLPQFFLRSRSRGIRGLFTRSFSPLREFPAAGFKDLSGTPKVEEENWEWYSTDAFYPVRIGEVFQSRYQVLGKLGYGAHSTAWLCRDLPEHKYVTLKICERDSASAQRELVAYNHLNALKSTHAGALVIRQLLDSFKVTGRAGEHLCLIHEPLGMSIDTLRVLMPGQELSEAVFKSLLKYLFVAIDYLHSEAKMVHTDLQVMNMHFGIEDENILKTFEENEMSDPSARKIDGDRVIYKSRGLILPKTTGRPVLCDFGEARYGEQSYEDDIQPYVYRAPEVILDIPWTFSVDIWNVGVMAWNMFENKQVFNVCDVNGVRSTEHHLASMVALLGPPPLDYLRRTETSWKYFSESGHWKAKAPILDTSLEVSETRLQSDNKASFLRFIRKMLQWEPEKRHTAEQLLEDPWLQS